MRGQRASQASVDALEKIPSMYYKPPSRTKSTGPLSPLNTTAVPTRRDRKSPTSPVRITSVPQIPIHGGKPQDEYASRVHPHVRPPNVARRHNTRPERDRQTTNSIPHLREALNTLENQMANLMYERRMLESRLEQAVRMQSPIHRLPRELLGRIFVHGVLETDEEEALLLSTLMLVCKEWAEVVLDNPVLWSHITISSHRSIANARLKLARSKSVPLYINLQFQPTPEQTHTITEVVIRAMDILRPAIWRWRSFRVAVPFRVHAHMALTQCKEPAPLLEDFHVQIHHFMQEDSYSKPPLPLFEGYLPRLRSCSFTSFNFGWDISLVSKLRVLKLSGFWNGFAPSVSTIVNILRECPNLEEFALRNMSDIETNSCPDSRQSEMNSSHAQILNSVYYPRVADMVDLPRLKKAVFYYAGLERMNGVFSQISFPALEWLEFSYMDNLTPILKHLKRQAFNSLPLNHLRIEACYFNELKLVRLLSQLPSLQTLELVDVEDVSSSFLNGLSYPPNSGEWICPNLEILNLDGCSSIDWDALRNLVEARLPTNATRILGPPTPGFLKHSASFALSSASSYAAAQKIHFSSSASSSASSYASRPTSSASTNRAASPRRLKTIDLTHCNQITKDMVQWLRVYVSEVRCETVKPYWGDG